MNAIEAEVDERTKHIQSSRVDPGTRAAIRAGHSKKTAASIGEENLRKPEIQAVLTERMAVREQSANYYIKLQFQKTAEWIGQNCSGKLTLSTWNAG